MMIVAMLAVLALGPVIEMETAPGERLVVHDLGTGPAVVLVPGLVGCAWGFRDLAPTLAAHGCRIIIIEPLGVGGSTRPASADYSLTAQADRIAAVLDALGAGPALLVGHGVAGSMVLRTASRRPDLAAGVALLEGGPDETATTPEVASSLRLASLAAKLGGARLLRDRFEDGLRRASGDPGWINGVVVRRYFAGASRDLDATIAALKAMAAASEPETITDKLPGITCPVTLVLGGADHSGETDGTARDAMRTGLVSYRETTIPGVGHYMFEENLQATAAAILEAAAPVRVAVHASASEGRLP